MATPCNISGSSWEKAQHLMHVACNDQHLYQTAADKILFQTIMTGAGLPILETLAVTQPLCWLPNAAALSNPNLLAEWLRDRPATLLLLIMGGGFAFDRSLWGCILPALSSKCDQQGVTGRLLVVVRMTADHTSGNVFPAVVFTFWSNPRKSIVDPSLN